MVAEEKQLWGRFGKIIGMFQSRSLNNIAPSSKIAASPSKLKGELILLICAAVMFTWSAQADANMTIYKLYKKTYSGVKAKCITCHISKVPKKSAFDVNEYGAKLIGEDGKVTVETITAAGEAE